MKLNKLKKVELRTVWKNEPNNFTKWLAISENLSLLGEEIGIEINLIKTEANVGKFNVDILAEEENTGRKIIIENQLEKTDHSHLGQLVTYASGFDAEIIIWIVKGVRDEYKQAIDWLNEHTDEEINFFIVKIELWQIGDSDIAPKFQIISKPNEWAKALKGSVRTKLTDTQMMQLDFWAKFKEYAIENKSKLRFRKVNPQHWYDISCGMSEAHICLIIDTRENQIRCELYISDSKETYNKFFDQKEKIEKDLNEKLEWAELLNKKASRIKISKDVDFNKVTEWEIYFEWLLTEANKFHKVFNKYK